MYIPLLVGGGAMHQMQKKILITTIAVFGLLSVFVNTKTVLASSIEINDPTLQVDIPVNTGQTPTSWQFRNVWSQTFSPGYTNAPYAFLKIKKGVNFNADLICMINGGEMSPAESIGNDWYRCATYYATVTQVGLTAKDTSGSNDPTRTAYAVYATTNNLQYNEYISTLPALAVVLSDDQNHVPGPNPAVISAQFPVGGSGLDFSDWVANIQNNDGFATGTVVIKWDRNTFYDLDDVTLGTQSQAYLASDIVNFNTTFYIKKNTNLDGAYYGKWFLVDGAGNEINHSATFSFAVDYSPIKQQTGSGTSTVLFMGGIGEDPNATTSAWYVDCSDATGWDVFTLSGMTCWAQKGLYKSIHFLFVPRGDPMGEIFEAIATQNGTGGVFPMNMISAIQNGLANATSTANTASSSSMLTFTMPSNQQEYSVDMASVINRTNEIPGTGKTMRQAVDTAWSWLITAMWIGLFIHMTVKIKNTP